MMMIVGLPLALGGLCYLGLAHHSAALRSRDVCWNNLGLIVSAKAMAAKDLGLKPGAAVSADTVAKYMEFGWPSCPAGGRYSVGPIGTFPTCRIHGQVPWKPCSNEQR